MRSKVLQALGRRLGKCFKDKDEVVIDNFVIARSVTHDKVERRDIKTYRFSSAPIADPGAYSQTDPDRTYDALAGRRVA